MHLIVVGAEPEGWYLIDCAMANGYRVTLIEADQDKARKVLRHHDIKVLNGTVGEESILAEANAKDADAIVATSADDAVNLMAMMLGQEYEIATRVAIARSSHHTQLFEKIGAKVITNPAEIVAKELYGLVDAGTKTGSQQ